MDFKSYLALQRETVNQALAAALARFCPNQRLKEPLAYVLLANGKRLRPVLCLASCQAVGGDEREAIPAACALEMIHTYSLIHDDLPALDNDALRRGRPTCHIRFDEATAILTGDALLTMAFEVIAEAGLAHDDVRMHAASLQAMHTIALAAGCRGMIEGQCRDLTFEGTELDRDDLEHLHALKTGALIRASVQSGAIMGGATRDQTDRLADYASHIGLAFQVVDDILNVTGDPEKMGKAVGTDQARHKNTYPALLGLEASAQFAQSLIDRALHALLIFGNTADPLRALARYIIERKR